MTDFLVINNKRKNILFTQCHWKHGVKWKMENEKCTRVRRFGYLKTLKCTTNANIEELVERYPSI